MRRMDALGDDMAHSASIMSFGGCWEELRRNDGPSLKMDSSRCQIREIKCIACVWGQRMPDV